MGNDFGGMAATAIGTGVIFLIVMLVIMAGAAILGVWLAYTLIWRAVRRGLREYYQGPTPPKSKGKSQALYPPRSW